MRVVVYDEVGGVALDYDTLSDTLSLCPGRLEKAQVIEALQSGVLRHGRTGTKPRRPQPFDSMFSRGTRESNAAIRPFVNSLKPIVDHDGHQWPW